MRKISCAKRCLSVMLALSLVSFVPGTALAVDAEGANGVPIAEAGDASDPSTGADGALESGDGTADTGAGNGDAGTTGAESGGSADGSTDTPSDDASDLPEVTTYGLDGAAAEPTPRASTAPTAAEATPVLTYDAHIRNIGWRNNVKEGQAAGTTGRGLRVEALRIRLGKTGAGNLPKGNIEYRTHVQNIGWQGWVKNGAVAGTTGRGLRVEAVQVRLTDDLAAKYDVYYRVHVRNIGWMGWAKDGAEAGTAAAGLRIEALQVELVKKGDKAPGGGVAYRPAVGVKYRSHVQNIGWRGYTTGVTGTTGRGLHMEALQISAPSTYNVKGGITYRAHVQNIGWQGWVSNGAIAGTSGRGLRMEAVQIKLTGDLASHYDVYYRAHSQTYGWLGWAKNGQSAGTQGCGYRMEALQIKIVAKGAAAPGANRNYFRNTPIYGAMTNRINGYASSTGWLIAVDTKSCRVGVYRGSKGHWSNVKYWTCSPGADRTPTVKGVFRVQNKGYVFGSGYSCYYWTQFRGNYLFHSVLYNQGTRTLQDGRLGQRISHGCVRLDINNAKWIYDSIPRNTTVVVW